MQTAIKSSDNFQVHDIFRICSRVCLENGNSGNASVNETSLITPTEGQNSCAAASQKSGTDKTNDIYDKSPEKSSLEKSAAMAHTKLIRLFFFRRH